LAGERPPHTADAAPLIVLLRFRSSERTYLEIMESTAHAVDGGGVTTSTDGQARAMLPDANPSTTTTTTAGGGVRAERMERSHRSATTTTTVANHGGGGGSSGAANPPARVPPNGKQKLDRSSNPTTIASTTTTAPSTTLPPFLPLSSLPIPNLTTMEIRQDRPAANATTARHGGGGDGDGGGQGNADERIGNSTKEDSVVIRLPLSQQQPQQQQHTPYDAATRATPSASPCVRGGTPTRMCHHHQRPRISNSRSSSISSNSSSSPAECTHAARATQ
jgi:hypothetical protein